MARPKKFPAARRDNQIVVYVQRIVRDALRREAEVRGVSVSTLAADILSEWVSSCGATINIPDETLYSVMRRLVSEGLIKDEILGDKFAPKKIDGDEFAPKNENPALEAVQDDKQRGDDGSEQQSAITAPKTTKRRAANRGKGGDSDDT
ncbi:hypothetical protein AAC03nite_26530 [Alicyclobacillus acidoterrestris]|nr:hypothetical protein AAC03nite_26530 [Alicyclobacillus acidoterrestris]